MFNKFLVAFTLTILGACSLLKPTPHGTFYNLASALVQPEQVLVLKLEHKQLKAVPEEIKTFKNLKELHLKRNALHSIPAWLADLEHLEKLSLGHNQFQGFPQEVLQLNQLKHLSLSGNRIATIPETLTQMKRLETLDLFDTYVETLPIEVLQKMPKMREIDLRQTFLFREKIAPYQAALPNITLLTMPGCDCNTPKQKLKQIK